MLPGYAPLSGRMKPVNGAIALMMWLSRAYANLDSVDPGRRRYGPGWEVGSWFIPFLNWYRPPTTSRMETLAWSKAQSQLSHGGGRFERTPSLFPTEVTN